MGSAFEHLTYKAALRARLEELRSTRSSFTAQALAQACRVQKAYLSRVFNADAHLSSDQLYLALDYLRFSASEKDYLFLLHEHDRSGIEERRRSLRREIDQRRQAQLKTEAHLKAEVLAQPSLEMLSSYYLDPMASVVHMALALPPLAAAPARLQTLLQLSSERLAAILETLEKLRLIERKGSGFVLQKNLLHLPRDSSLFAPYRSLMRLHGLSQLQRTGSEKAYNHVAVIAATPETREKIQADYLSFLAKVENAVRQVKRAEEVFQIQFDLVPWI